MTLNLTLSTPAGSIEYGSIEIRHIKGAFWEVTHALPGEPKRVKPLRMTVFKALEDSPWKVVRAAVNTLVGSRSSKYFIDKRGKVDRVVSKRTLKRTKSNETNRLQPVQGV